MSIELFVEGDREWVCPQQARVVTSEPSSMGAEITRNGTRLAEKGSNVPRPGEQSSLRQLREESTDPGPASSEHPRKHGFSLNPRLPSCLTLLL